MEDKREDKKEDKFAEMSDKWLDALIEQKEKELRELTDEHDRRRRAPSAGNRHMRVLNGRDANGMTITLARLEEVVHEFGDAYGFDSLVTFRDGNVLFAERSGQ